ncbi:MAG: hypothetical protein HY272_09140 [Gammaproteobacteria bacterium]|nr:hypothetical protein [Gammaproteobacteria bacterium]
MDARCKKHLVQHDCYLVCLGFAVFTMDCLFYALTRSSPHIFFLSDLFAPIFSGHPSVPVWDALPSFLHTFSFVLISVGIIGCRRLSKVIAIAWMWIGVELLFELGQHPALRVMFADALPAWFEQVPIFDQTARYFMRGTYDALDVTAIFAAAGLAILAIQLLRSKGERYEWAVTDYK